MEFSRPEYFSVLPFPSPGELPNPGIESACPGFFTGTEPPGKPLNPYNLSDLDPVLQSKKLREVEAVAQAHTARIPALVGQLIRHPSPGSFVRGSSQVRILEWVAISFSRGTSQPGDQTRVYCIAGGFFTTEPSGKPLKDNRCSINIHFFLKKVEMTQAACPDGETETRA